MSQDKWVFIIMEQTAWLYQVISNISITGPLQVKYILFKDNGSDSKIQIIMNDGTKCRFNNSENYSITLNLQCNNSQDSLFFDDSIDDFDMSKCNYILNATTKHGTIY